MTVKWLDEYWSSYNWFAFSLLPLSWIFCAITWIRSTLYKRSLIKINRLPVPVIIVGNITVGGTGKTPLVVWLVEYLRSQGYRPGVIARGYGGKAMSWPRQVVTDSDPLLVGDEPLLIANRCACHVWVGPDRTLAAKALLESSDCDIIISDDGMQHYALGRDIEIAVIDGQRRMGNGLCLPAGPLRERPSRLSQVDLIVVNGCARTQEHPMIIVGWELISLTQPERRMSLNDASKLGQVHAIAGIGNPERFFSTLRDAGLTLLTRSFPDHHNFTTVEINPDDDLPVFMTEKDAVKCYTIASQRHWYLKVNASLGSRFSTNLKQLLGDLNNG